MSDNIDFPGFKDEAQPAEAQQNTSAEKEADQSAQSGYTPQFGFDGQQPSPSAEIYNMSPASSSNKSKAPLFALLGIIAVLVIAGIFAFLNRSIIMAKINPTGYLSKSILKTSEAAAANMANSPTELVEQFGLAAEDGEIRYDFDIEIEDAALGIEIAAQKDSETDTSKANMLLDVLGIGLDFEFYADKNAVVASTPLLNDGKLYGLEYKNIRRLNDKYELGMDEETLKIFEDMSSFDAGIDKEATEKLGLAVEKSFKPAAEYIKAIKPEVFKMENTFEDYDGKSICIEYVFTKEDFTAIWDVIEESFSDPELKQALMELPSFEESLTAYALEQMLDYDDIYDDVFIEELVVPVDDLLSGMSDDFTTTLTFFTSKDGYLTNVYSKSTEGINEATLLMGFGADPSAAMLFTCDFYGDAEGSDYVNFRYEVLENTDSSYMSEIGLTAAYSEDSEMMMYADDYDGEGSTAVIGVTFDWNKTGGSYSAEAKADITEYGQTESVSMEFSGDMKLDKAGESKIGIDELSLVTGNEEEDAELADTLEMVDFSFDMYCTQGADVTMPQEYLEAMDWTEDDISEMMAMVEDWINDLALALEQ